MDPTVKQLYNISMNALHKLLAIFETQHLTTRADTSVNLHLLNSSLLEFYLAWL